MWAQILYCLLTGVKLFKESWDDSFLHESVWSMIKYLFTNFAENYWFHMCIKQEVSVLFHICSGSPGRRKTSQRSVGFILSSHCYLCRSQLIKVKYTLLYLDCIPALLILLILKPAFSIWADKLKEWWVCWTSRLHKKNALKLKTPYC